MRLGIRLPDGQVVTDPEWRCVADVMRGAAAHGRRVIGELVEIDDAPGATCRESVQVGAGSGTLGIERGDKCTLDQTPGSPAPRAFVMSGEE